MERHAYLVPLLLWAASSAGCGWLSGEDPPADLPDAAALCADPSAPFTIHEITPPALHEGQGCALTGAGPGCDEGLRGVPVVVRGSCLPPDAAITLAGGGLESMASDVRIASDGSLAAFVVRVPVQGDRGAGESDVVEVTVSHDGFEVGLPLTVHWLDELVASRDLSEVHDLDELPLAPLYSRIDIDAPVELTGSAPARLVATAGIVISEPLRADGKPPEPIGGAQGGRAGPGGCAGGNRAQTADCDGGGSAGASVILGLIAGGGGGGGHADRGAPGRGLSGGQGGSPSGDFMLTPLDGSPERPAGGHGGGGGGDSGGDLLGPSAAGGGGGGVIELSTWGRLVIEEDGLVSAQGGAGGRAPCLLAGGGSGGGGSGGAILLRAALALDDETGGRAWIDVRGGSGGSGDGLLCNAGGHGAPGRVRFDAPHRLPHLAPLPEAIASSWNTWRGPVFEPATPAITGRGTGPVTIHGALGATFWIEHNGAPLGDLPVYELSEAWLDVELAPGHNRLCALVSPEAADEPEGKSCLDIAYVP